TPNRQRTMRYLRLWIALFIVIGGSLAVLRGFGFQMERQLPPIPTRVVTTDGRLVVDGEAVRRGQNVWQSLGGQEVGTIWGHGAYVAPDWSADWLHREATFILDRWARQAGAPSYTALEAERQAALQARLQRLMRTNTYDPRTGAVTLEPVRAEAYAANAAHYA